MATLAACYHEDFHYPSPGSYKQRKSAYILYNEPQNNLMTDADRLRSLATSDPILYPEGPYVSRELDVAYYHKTLMNNHYLDSQLLPNESYENYYNCRQDLPRYHDNESQCSYVPSYNVELLARSASGRTKKRFSYVDPQGGQLILPESYVTQSHQALLCDNREYEHPMDDRMFYHVDPKYQHWAIHSLNHFTRSPPSPLDSGLSSQSLASSPSLEIDPAYYEQEHIQNSRPRRHHVCRCPPQVYNDKGRQTRLSRNDSSRSNDTQYSSSYRVSRNGSFYEYSPLNGSFDSNTPYDNQVRYGKLGLIGETAHPDCIIKAEEKLPREAYHSDFPQQYNYRYVSENGTYTKRPIPRPRKNKPGQKYIRPSVVITEASEVAAGDHPCSDGKPGNPESPMSMTGSNSSSIASSTHELESDDCRKSNQTTEKEIRELENMYHKCNLNDRDLLDRAERRDLPTAHQISSSLKRCKSDTLYEMSSPLFHNPYQTPQRAPPSRRSGLPDKIADDMALRKLRKSAKRQSSNPLNKTISYMLCSTHFTPSVPSPNDILTTDNPDVELDDFSYRKHYLRKRGEIPDPQPPFGIPLRPPPIRTVCNDYLHAVPSGAPQPLCHPRGNPDVVRDDLAVRALRRDEPERVYCDIAQVYARERPPRRRLRN